MEVVPIASGILTATTEVQTVELLKHVQQDIPITMEIATLLLAAPDRNDGGDQGVGKRNPDIGGQ
ncbi:hypothetical protein MCETRH34_00513 [Candidatus Methylopumilus universalis]